jgi:ABC-type polar amino acid transport system ATPase subunit
MALIETEKLTRLYHLGDETVTALLEVTLAIDAGDFVAVMGPSGSGKSTFMNVIGCLDRPTSGIYRLDDQVVSALDSDALAAVRCHKIGFVFQQFNLFPHMTVLENIIEAPVHAQNVPREKAIAHARELLEMVGLAQKERSYPAQLSGGQQQRVAIARTLATRPEILLCDEPTSALDVELVGEVLGVLRNLARETRMTMVFVTHEIRFAREVSDRIIFMDHGRVLESGSPDALLGAPRHERTRSFLKAVLEA